MSSRAIQTAIFISAVAGLALWLAGCATGGTTRSDTEIIIAEEYPAELFEPALTGDAE